MENERSDLLQQVLDLRSELYRSLRPAREWLEIDLTTSQLKVLFLLFSTESASMGQLAGSLGVTLSTVTGIVDRLVEHGMVVRDEDPHDRRLVVCRLTSAGSAIAERLNHAGNTRLREVISRLSADQLRCVVAGLQMLTDAVRAQAAEEQHRELLNGDAQRRTASCEARAMTGALFGR